MSPRGRNFGLRKVCDCGRSRWAKCVHAWNFNFKPRGGPPYRFSLDAELGRHISSKTEAEHEATRIKAAILAGTFRRVASVPISDLAGLSVTTLDQFAAIYLERVSKASGKASWKDDEHLLSKVREHRCPGGRRLGEWALASITEDEIEAFCTALQAAGRAASTRNHYVQLVKSQYYS